jgi:hypothetical protein
MCFGAIESLNIKVSLNDYSDYWYIGVLMIF